MKLCDHQPENATEPRNIDFFVETYGLVPLCSHFVACNGSASPKASERQQLFFGSRKGYDNFGTKL